MACVLIMFLMTSIRQSLAGGITVGSTLTWYVEATAKADTLIVWHGPKGTAAEFSTASDG